MAEQCYGQTGHLDAEAGQLVAEAEADHPVAAALDDLPASSMALLGDAFCTTVKLEELKTKLREGGRLNQPNHADADVLLRAWADPTVAALVPTITANKVPPEGGTFFLHLSHAGAGAPSMQAGANWLSFAPNGGPSLNFSSPGKRSREEDERVFRNSQSNNEGITRHGCSITTKVELGRQGVPAAPCLRIMKFQVVALPGHRNFPPDLARLGGVRSSQCKEAKLPRQKGDYWQLADPPCALIHAEPREVPTAEWHTFQKLSVKDELQLKGVNIFELLEKLQRNIQDLQCDKERQPAPGPSGCQWSSRVESQSADFAEWFRKQDPSEEIKSGDVVFIHGGKITLRCPPHSFGVIASVVSTDPAVLGNWQLDAAERDLGMNVMLLGQGPIRVQGKASEVPRASILVPSGMNDGH